MGSILSIFMIVVSFIFIQLLPGQKKIQELYIKKTLSIN